MTDLLNKAVRLSAFVGGAVGGHAVLIQHELEIMRLAADRAILEATLAQLLGKVIEYLNVVCNVAGIVLGDDWHLADRLAIDDILGFAVAQLRSRSETDISSAC